MKIDNTVKYLRNINLKCIINVDAKVTASVPVPATSPKFKILCAKL